LLVLEPVEEVFDGCEELLEEFFCYAFGEGFIEVEEVVMKEGEEVREEVAEVLGVDVWGEFGEELEV
jgi:hypothetical protein